MKSIDFKRKKQNHKKISLLTCYDYPSAKMAAETKLDCLLVGDSVAMMVHGYPSTIHATMPMMVTHTAAVARGLGEQFLIADLPFLSYRGERAHTIVHVQQLLQAGAHAVKLEGGDRHVCETIEYLVQAGIVVIGHIGLTPQFIHQLGGYRVQGKSAEQATQLLHQAQQLEQAGCTALILECIPGQLAKHITERLEIPTIGIGSGRQTDGQILVWHDIFGLQNEIQPRFVKEYLRLQPQLVAAMNQYHQDVNASVFPGEEHTYC